MTCPHASLWGGYSATWNARLETGSRFLPVAEPGRRLVLMWQTQMEIQASGFRLVQPWLVGAFEA